MVDPRYCCGHRRCTDCTQSCTDYVASTPGRWTENSRSPAVDLATPLGYRAVVFTIMQVPDVQVSIWSIPKVIIPGVSTQKLKRKSQSCLQAITLCQCQSPTTHCVNTGKHVTRNSSKKSSCL